MSPGSSCGNPHISDRRSDLYSVGVICWSCCRGAIRCNGMISGAAVAAVMLVSCRGRTG